MWSKTALLITFDENDGFSDHVVAPYPNVGGLAGQSTVPLDNELLNGKAGTPGGSDGVVGPYGLGVRVPLLVVSPWSSGGWVCSETFDHTSLIRFIEARFGVGEPKHHSVAAGHLRRSDRGVRFRERFRFCATLPGVAAYKPTGTASGSYHPIPPASGSVPVQEQGVRPSRRLAYRFDVDFDAGSKTLSLGVKNRGRLGIHLQPRSLTVAGAPYSYTIGAGDELAIALANPGT